MRRMLEAMLLGGCGLLLFRAVAAEPFRVPTGSMAPALWGRHRELPCPRCGFPVRVAVPETAADGSPEAFWGVTCPHCGRDGLNLADAPLATGDHLLVNKFLYDVRRPRRWEVVVFRTADAPAAAPDGAPKGGTLAATGTTAAAGPGRTYVKRLVGLPGEAVHIRDGDVFIDLEPARKTLAQARGLRVPVFDLAYPPREGDWSVRFERRPFGTPVLEDGRPHLDARDAHDAYQWLVYRHTFDVSTTPRPIYDDGLPGAGESGRAGEAVHDFLAEWEVVVQPGTGWLAVGVQDGSDEIVAEVPVGEAGSAARLSEVRPGDPPEQGTLYRTAPGTRLVPGQRHRIELAFVDRRASLAVDGREVVAPLDRPARSSRPDVVRPARLGARGVDVTVTRFRLGRDVHYTASGRHGTRSPVRLGEGELFVLGDNSPASEDSRSWSREDGSPRPVREADIVGKAFLAHTPGPRSEPAGTSLGRFVRRLRLLR